MDGERYVSGNIKRKEISMGIFHYLHLPIIPSDMVEYSLVVQFGLSSPSLSI